MSTRGSIAGAAVPSLPSFRSSLEPLAMRTSSAQPAGPSRRTSEQRRFDSGVGSGSTRSSMAAAKPAPYRRESAMSRVSGSGVSTPRQGKVGGAAREPADDKDWASMEPDEVFRRLPVTEVKRVEARLRTDALNKQSELRSMVGTRYRDLMTSATQITTLHSSSLHLSSSLQSIAQACANPNDVTPTVDGASDRADDEDIVNRLPVAAHMKLLLDAPEALYTFLNQHAYLNAAFLWLVARVVRESLMAMPEELNGKQWDTLLPFRQLIIQRATTALKSREQLDSKTLLAIILLDNLTLSDALDLFLAQRLKALRELLAHTPSATPNSQSLDVPASRRRRDSRVLAAAAVREAIHGRDHIADVLTAAIRSLLSTTALVNSVFGARKRISGDESMIADVVRLVQDGEGAPHAAPQPVRQTSSHMRRASRLASISLPLPRMNSHGRAPPVSATAILEYLPSSQTLLRHLPPSITGFTPFITPSAPPAIADKVESWQRTAVAVLCEHAPSWLQALQSIADVWHVRSTLKALLTGGDFETRIADALEHEWAARVTQLWEGKLDALLQSCETAVRDAAENIRNDPATDDKEPEALMFADVMFPTGPTGLAAHTTPFASFVSTLKKRSARRSPTLDSVLLVFEDAATDLKADMQGLPAPLYEEYKGKIQGALDQLVRVLSRVLESVGPARGDGRNGVEAELFVGRVALYLAKSSSFLADAVGEAEFDLAETTQRLIAVHATSTQQWQARAVEESLSLLAPVFDPLRGSREVQLSWQGPHPTGPSPALILALTTLAVSVRRVGAPPKVALPVGPNAMQAFAEAARTLPGWATKDGSAAAQAAVDLAFLAVLCGGTPEKDISVQDMLAKVPPDFPPSFASELSHIALEALRRSQLILQPLTSHLAPPESTAGRKSTTGDSRNASLLRLGAPTAAARTAIGTEFKNAIAVAKPGKRFGLLSVVA